MKLKDLYLENTNHRYNNVTRVKKENIILKMNPIKKIQENWIVLLGILVVIIGFLIMNFNARVFIISLILMYGNFLLQHQLHFLPFLVHLLLVHFLCFQIIV